MNLHRLNCSSAMQRGEIVLVHRDHSEFWFDIAADQIRGQTDQARWQEGAQLRARSPVCRERRTSSADCSTLSTLLKMVLL
jgi:hypothetical protein